MNQLLRLPGLQEYVPECKSGIYAKIADELLPPPVKIGRLSTWPADEIDAVIQARIAGKTNDEIRDLVRKLVVARQKVA
jgi:prophage regulatory protein